MRQWINDIGHRSFIRSKLDNKDVSKTMQSHIYGTYENETLDAQSNGLNAAEEIQKVYK